MVYLVDRGADPSETADVRVLAARVQLDEAKGGRKGRHGLHHEGDLRRGNKVLKRFNKVNDGLLTYGGPVTKLYEYTCISNNREISSELLLLRKLEPGAAFSGGGRGRITSLGERRKLTSWGGWGQRGTKKKSQ
jgi:hypothetical protein